MRIPLREVNGLPGPGDLWCGPDGSEERIDDRADDIMRSDMLLPIDDLCRELDDEFTNAVCELLDEMESPTKEKLTERATALYNIVYRRARAIAEDEFSGEP